MNGKCFFHISDMKLFSDHVANAEIYRCGVESAAGLAM